MAWSGSAVFRAFVTDKLGNATAMNLGADSFKVALYNNSITPDKDATSANSAYNVSQWASANEQSQSGQWAAGGVALTSRSLTNPASGVAMFAASDTASGSATTLSNVYGCLVYDDTIATPVAKQGVCFNYFGGGQSVSAGTLTVVWSANGIMRITA